MRPDIKIEFDTAGTTAILVVAGKSVFSMTVEEARELRHQLNLNKQRLRPNKNWGDCPYEGHADDCTCRGEGGDR